MVTRYGPQPAGAVTLDPITTHTPYTMFISRIGFQVTTKDAPNAGTDSLLTMEVLRNGNHLWTGRLDFPDLNDNERGDSRFYGYTFRSLFLDRTPHLPDGIGRIPMPYPDRGMEFSDGLNGHLRCRLHNNGDDMWIKDQVNVHVRIIRQRATSFDTLDWIEDNDWTFVGSFTQDVALSTDSREGVERWTMAV